MQTTRYYLHPSSASSPFCGFSLQTIATIPDLRKSYREVTNISAMSPASDSLTSQGILLLAEITALLFNTKYFRPLFHHRNIL